MSNTTLERAARAALWAEMDHNPGTWETQPDQWESEALHSHGYVKIARAVLMAVREPDEAMKTAWLNAEMHGTESAWFLHRHRAMIDAILADGGE